MGGGWSRIRRREDLYIKPPYSRPPPLTHLFPIGTPSSLFRQICGNSCSDKLCGNKRCSHKLFRQALCEQALFPQAVPTSCSDKLCGNKRCSHSRNRLLSLTRLNYYYVTARLD